MFLMILKDLKTKVFQVLLSKEAGKTLSHSTFITKNVSDPGPSSLFLTSCVPLPLCLLWSRASRNSKAFLLPCGFHVSYHYCVFISCIVISDIRFFTISPTWSSSTLQWWNLQIWRRHREWGPFYLWSGETENQKR